MAADYLGEHLPATALASVLGSLREIAGADGLAEEEDEFIAALIEAWQVAPAGEEAEDGDDEDDEDADDDEDEESEDDE